MMKPFTFWATIIHFSISWFVFDDIQKAVITSIWLCASIEAFVRTRAGLRNLAELRRLEQAVAESREGVK